MRSALVCVFFASIISSQRVIAALAEAGGAMSFFDRFYMTVYDLHHFGSMYAIFILIAFLIAFAAGTIVFRFAGFGRSIVFVVAGATAMLVMLLLMERVFFGVPIVGGARDGIGLALQMVAGGLGGFVFHRLSNSLSTQST